MFAGFYPKDDVSKGTYAQYAAVDEGHLAALPAAIPLDTAGGLPLVGLTAWQVGKPCSVQYPNHARNADNCWVIWCPRTL
jgi:NADPH:quinone reductase-like Zn-dependent oxidoreductase